MKMKKPPRDNLGEVLLDLGTITEKQLNEALSQQTNGGRRPLGVILISLGYVTAVEIDYALMRQRARRGSFGHDDGVRLLQQATQQTQQSISCIDELAVAAQELAAKAKA